VFLAISALVAIWMDPTVIGYSPWAYWLLGVYICHSVAVMLLLRYRRQSTPAFRLLVHTIDIFFPALISLFAASQFNPFFLFFIFVLAAAAYRWGFWETLATALYGVLLLWVESLIVARGFVPWIDGILDQHHLRALGIVTAELTPSHLFMRCISLIVIGLLLGYMAEQQKQLRAEKAVIARILGKASVEAGMSGTVQQIMGEILGLYGAHRSLIASQEAKSFLVFLGEVNAVDGKVSAVRWLESSLKDHENYLYPSPAAVCYAEPEAGSFRTVALDNRGTRLRDLDTTFLSRLHHAHYFQSLLAVAFDFGEEWAGRIFLFDSQLTGDPEDELRFLQEIVRQVGPAVYNVYLLRKLRLRAGAVERARFARELHDGAVQSLIAMEMQVDVLRRQSTTQPEAVTEELGRIQSLLREEVLKLRELMQQMKSMEVDSKRLVPFLTSAVERFQRETGIAARFISDSQEIDAPARVCRELARIAQEGLVNIRKHSGAAHALVQLGRRDGGWRLIVEDDGSGFAFSGRRSQQQLDQANEGPLVIRERVRLIEGELTVESTPGMGARLEISVPLKPGNGVRLPHG
jgi:signal transduction histidine kinase